MSKNENLHFISIIQIIGMFLIVLSHSISRYAEYPEYCGRFVQAIQQAGLSAFMWCSGYLLVHTNSISRDGYGTYIRKRATRLLLPYIVIQLLMLAPKILIARLTDTEMSVNLIHSFLWPREGILPHLWFLPTLMIICVMAPCLAWGIETQKRASATLTLLFAVSLLPSVPNIFALNDVKHYLFWFALGMVFAKHLEVRKINISNLKFWGGVLLFVTVYVCSTLFIKASSVQWMICNLCTLFVLLLVGLYFDRQSILEKLSRYTYTIYILSLPVQNVFEVLMGKFSINYVLATVAMFITGILIPLIIAIVVNKLEQKSKIKLISKCIGL